MSAEFISPIVAYSSNDATDLICAISICLSYPHIAHLRSFPLLSNTNLAFFTIVALAENQLHVLLNNSFFVIADTSFGFLILSFKFNNSHISFAVFIFSLLYKNAIINFGNWYTKKFNKQEIEDFFMLDYCLSMPFAL